jgi:hypothetical protein
MEDCESCVAFCQAAFPAFPARYLCFSLAGVLFLAPSQCSVLRPALSLLLILLRGYSASGALTVALSALPNCLVRWRSSVIAPLSFVAPKRRETTIVAIVVIVFAFNHGTVFPALLECLSAFFQRLRINLLTIDSDEISGAN